MSIGKCGKPWQSTKQCSVNYPVDGEGLKPCLAWKLLRDFASVTEADAHCQRLRRVLLATVRGCARRAEEVERKCFDALAPGPRRSAFGKQTLPAAPLMRSDTNGQIWLPPRHCVGPPLKCCFLKINDIHDLFATFLSCKFLVALLA